MAQDLAGCDRIGHIVDGIHLDSTNDSSRRTRAATPPPTSRKLSRSVAQGIASALTAFIENPVTNLVKGIAPVLIGVTEVSRIFREDIMQAHVRVGHGIIIIGTFSIFEPLPHIIEGLNANRKFLEQKKTKGDVRRETENP